MLGPLTTNIISVLFQLQKLEHKVCLSLYLSHFIQVYSTVYGTDPRNTQDPLIEVEPDVNNLYMQTNPRTRICIVNTVFIL